VNISGKEKESPFETKNNSILNNKNKNKNFETRFIKYDPNQKKSPFETKY